MKVISIEPSFYLEVVTVLEKHNIKYSIKEEEEEEAKKETKKKHNGCYKNMLKYAKSLGFRDVTGAIGKDVKEFKIRFEKSKFNR